MPDIDHGIGHGLAVDVQDLALCIHGCASRARTDVFAHRKLGRILKQEGANQGGFCGVFRTGSLA